MGAVHEMDGRSALRAYQAARLDQHADVQTFVRALDRLHDTMEADGGKWLDKARIWHCLNCLEDADADWSTNLIDSTAALPPKPAYWTVFSTWAGFSKELVCRAGHAQVFPSSRDDAAPVASRQNKPRRPHAIEEDGLYTDYASSHADDDSDADTASYDGSYSEEDYGNAISTRAIAAHNSHWYTAKKEEPLWHTAKKEGHSTATNARHGTLPLKNFQHPKPRVQFGSPLHEFTDYQFHCDDDKDFKDEDQDAVVINGERRFLIPGYSKARRNERGLLIDANFRMLKFFFFRRFTFCPRCVECKLRHPVETYSFCRFCYFCHLGGEQECYHLHPELRGTRSEKGKYRSSHGPGPVSRRRPQNGPVFSLADLAEFGYDGADALTRARVRKMRRHILLMPFFAQNEAVQKLLEMVAADREKRTTAQQAKQARERQEEEEQAAERLEMERLEREREMEKEREKEREREMEKEREKEREQRVLDLAMKGRPSKPSKSSKKKRQARPPPKPDFSFGGHGQPLPNQGRFIWAPRSQLSRATTPALSSEGPAGWPLYPGLPFRGKPSASPSAAPGLPATPSTTLGTNLIFPEEPHAPAASDKPKNERGGGAEASTLEPPRFLKNRRRWSSMDSLSTSSSEESIQQFDKQRLEAQKKAMSSRKGRGGANPRFNGPRIPGRAAGGAALT